MILRNEGIKEFRQRDIESEKECGDSFYRKEIIIIRIIMSRNTLLPAALRIICVNDP